MRHFSRRILLATLSTLLLVPATAAHASGEDVLSDCNDNGRLDEKYSQSEYSDALENMPTDLDEYTNCREVIRRAQAGRASSGGSDSGGGGATGGAGGGGGSTGGAVPPAGANDDLSVTEEALANATPEERGAIANATATGGAGADVGGRLVKPGNVGASDLSSTSGMPAPLIATLALLGVGVLAGGALGLRSRVHPGRA